MERSRITDTLKIASLPLVVAFALSACSKEPTTIEQQLNKTFGDATELCHESAQEAYDEKFVAVENDPSTPVDEVYEATKLKETEGAEFFETHVTNCVDENFYNVVDGLKLEVTVPGANESAPVTTVVDN
jgi:hypothetical protein